MEWNGNGKEMKWRDYDEQLYFHMVLEMEWNGDGNGMETHD